MGKTKKGDTLGKGLVRSRKKAQRNVLYNYIYNNI